MQIRMIGFAATYLVLTSCATDPVSEFEQDRTLDACNENVPVCTTVASCALDAGNYVSGSFADGPPMRFLIHTDAAAEVSLEILFETEGSPGTNTQVVWYEAACASSTTDSSTGVDIFQQAGPGRVWSDTHPFLSGGDHLVELSTDAQASYLLRVAFVQGQ